MTDRHTILAILETDSHPDKLISRAKWLAQTYDCDLHLVLFEPESALVGEVFSFSTEVDSMREVLHQAQKDYVEEQAEKIRAAGIVVATSVCRERPLGDAVLAMAEEMQVRLVVKATRRHTMAERGILVDTDWQLMRVCQFPLWFVKADEMPDKPVIIAAVDPGHAHDKPAALDHLIIKAARDLGAAANGDVHLAHSYEAIAELGAAATWALTSANLALDEFERRMKKEHGDGLARLAAENDIDASHTLLMPGRAHEVLPDVVRQKHADVFVMGALSRWGWKRMIIGSTAERIIDRLPCDILLVRFATEEDAAAAA